MWNALPAEEVFGVKAKINSDGHGVIHLTSVMPFPDNFPLVLGEMLYQLRSALDACIYQGAVYASHKTPPPDENKLEFPITSDAAGFAKLAKQKMSPLPQKIQNAIEKIQPYHIPSVPPEEMVKDIGRSLGILNDLARKDRHRKLHLAGPIPIKLKPTLMLPPGVKMTSMKIMEPKVLESNTILASFELKGFVMGMKTTANPGLVTTIGVNEPPPPCHANDTFDRRIVEMMNAVNSVIVAFERYF